MAVKSVALISLLAVVFPILDTLTTLAMGASLSNDVAFRTQVVGIWAILGQWLPKPTYPNRSKQTPQIEK